MKRALLALAGAFFVVMLIVACVWVAADVYIVYTLWRQQP